MVAFLGFYGQYLANGLVRPAAARRGPLPAVACAERWAAGCAA
jgi:hypothetical protein